MNYISFYFTFNSSGSVTEDGRYLIVDVSRGCDPYNMLYYYDVQEAQQKITGKVSLKPLFDKLDAKYEVSVFHRIHNDNNCSILIVHNFDIRSNTCKYLKARYS